MSVHRVHSCYLWRLEEGIKSCGLEFQMLVSYRVGSGYQIKVTLNRLSWLFKARAESFEAFSSYLLLPGEWLRGPKNCGLGLQTRITSWVPEASPDSPQGAFKVRPVQVALDNAPEGLYLPFSLGDCVAGQVGNRQSGVGA